MTLQRSVTRSGHPAAAGNLPLAARYFMLWLVMVSLLMAAALYLQFRQDRSLAVARESIRLGLVHGTLVRHLASVAEDVRELAQEPSVQAYLHSTSEEDRQQVMRELFSFAKYKRHYAQVRLLTPDGQELVRVDSDATGARRVPDDELQNKGQRYYVQSALGLPPGRILVSPLDLNVEHGVVERPFRPMIRFILPLRDGDAVRLLLVLNYNAELLLSDFDRAVADASGRVELLNSDGYWLRSPEPSLEWGFMFPDGPTLAGRQPALWSALRDQAKGVQAVPGGQVLFDTVRPLQEQRKAAGEVPWFDAGEPLSWTIVSELSDGQLLAGLWQRHGLAFAMAWLTLLLAGGAGAWLLARTRREHDQMQHERLLHASVFDAATDAMLITDPDGKILSINAAFTRQNGYTLDEVVGRRPGLLNSGRQDVAFYQRLWRELVQQGYWQGELWDRRKDGSEYPVWLRISAIRADDGQLLAYVGLASDITAQQKEEEALRQQGQHDHLTGLVNRRLFRDRLHQSLAWATRTGSEVALCYLDLDRFKPINDNHGHEAGDHVLRLLAQRMREVLREVDTVARIGGDEFALILVGQDEQAVATVVARLQQVLCQPFDWHGRQLHLDSSVGMVRFPRDGDDIDALIHKADMAMYAAKRAGGSAALQYSDELDDERGRS